MATYDTSVLLANIRRRCSAPTAAPAGSADADLLALATDEMREGLQPLLMKLRQEHFVVTTDIAIVAGTAAYDMPARAIGLHVRDIGTVDTSGKFFSLDQMEIDELDGQDTASGAPTAFYLMDTQIVLYPTPSAAGTLRVPYFCSRSTLVTTSAVATVSAVNTGTGAVTLTGIPSTHVTSARFDLVRATPHFRTLAADQTASIAGSVFTFPVASVAALAIGDQVCLAGEAAVPQIPVALHPILAQRAANAWMQASGSPGLKDGVAKSQQMEAEVLDVLVPRVDGEVQLLTSAHWYPGAR